MDENVSKSPDQGENAENKIAPSAASETPLESKASDSKLRVVWCDSKLRDVWSPKLNLSEGVADDFARAGAGERTTASSADTAQDAFGEAAAQPASDATLPRSLRLAMLAAPVAAAAALGAFVGSFSASGVAQFWPRIAPSSSNVAASGGMRASKAELAESALKTNLEGTARNLNNQFARLAERLDRIERAEAEPHAKLAHIAEAVDRLEKERTAPSAALAAMETTGTIPNDLSAPAESKPPENVLPDWILHAVRGSHALVENRHGGIFDITGGSMLPGLGQVEAIKRQDGHWVVVTARGLITSVP
jgi:hypothetical protein